MNIITPREVIKDNRSNIPINLIAAINELISEKFDQEHRVAVIPRGAVCGRVFNSSTMEKGATYFNDLKAMYEEAGWEVGGTKFFFTGYGTETLTFRPRKKHV